MPIARVSRALAALSLSLLGAAAWGAELGTLFHTPEERARLDKLRRGEPEVATYARASTPTLTGFVKRSDGRNTVWIDGAPVPVARPEAGPLLDPKSVRPYTGRSDETLKIERKTPR